MPLMVITFNSCLISIEKEVGGESGGNGGNGHGITKLIKSLEYSDVDSQEALKYFYDSQQRLIKIDNSYSYNYEDYSEPPITITYDNNHIIMDLEGDKIIYTLDNNGYVSRVEDSYSLSSPSPEYSNGYVTKWNNAAYGVNTTYTWEDGNLIQIVEDFPDGAKCTRTLTYNNIEDNKTTIPIPTPRVLRYEKYIGNQYIANFSRIDPNFIIKLKGFTSKNYLVRETISYRTGTGWTTSYSFSFDSSGYPTKVTISDPEDTQTSIITYY